MRDEKLSKNFMRSEFACKGVNCCGGAAPVHPALVRLLQLIRDAVDEPVNVLSGFRCITHNNSIPGANPESYHTLGMAADIHVKGMSVKDLAATVARVIALEGYGKAIAYEKRGFIHIDVRDC
jgi:zinc D-Ala-D-Ala carboxypeptidase